MIQDALKKGLRPKRFKRAPETVRRDRTADDYLREKISNVDSMYDLLLSALDRGRPDYGEVLVYMTKPDGSRLRLMVPIKKPAGLDKRSCYANNDFFDQLAAIKSTVWDKCSNPDCCDDQGQRHLLPVLLMHNEYPATKGITSERAMVTYRVYCPFCFSIAKPDPDLELEDHELKM